MADSIASELDFSSAQINVGAGFDTLAVLPLNQPAINFLMRDLTSGVTFGNNPTIFLLAALGYLSDIWQRTAGAAFGDGTVSSGAVSGTGTVSAGALELVKVQFTAATYPSDRRYIDGHFPIQDYGWIAFNYAGYSGKLEKICFEKQIFYPEIPGAESFTFYLNEGASGSFYGITRDINGKPIQGNASSPIQFGGNNVTGVQQGSPTIGISGNGEEGFIAVPAQDSSQDLLTHTFGFYYWIKDLVTLYSDFPIQTAVLAHIVEIWQKTAGINASADVLTSDTISGADNYQEYVGAFCTDMYLDVIVEPDGPDVDFGATGAKFFGYVVSMHNGYCGRLQYINSVLSQFTPSYPDCTGWSIILKPGVTATRYVPGNTQRCAGLTTPSGTVSLADGHYAGLSTP